MNHETLTAIPRPTPHSKEKAAFRVEFYKEPISELSLRDDLVSYLGEYRFRVPVYEYELFFKYGSDGRLVLRDRYEGEAMRDKALKSIQRCQSEGKPWSREEAELAGIDSLDEQLRSSTVGDLIVWISPPGREEEGYGDYGFVYLGRVGPDEGKGKRIPMKAFIIENPSLEKFSQFLYLLTGKIPPSLSDAGFLANPDVLNADFTAAQELLFEVLNFVPDYVLVQKFDEAIAALTPQIFNLIDLVKADAPYEQRKSALNVLENLAAAFYKHAKRESPENIIKILNETPAGRIQQIFSYDPPKVAGSCGSTGGSTIRSLNIFNSIGSVNSLFEGNSDKKILECVKCPFCEETVDAEVRDGKIHCPKCGASA